jgi:hypothetical protein
MLFAVDTGKMHAFRGKTLDDITVDGIGLATFSCHIDILRSSQMFTA